MMLDRYALFAHVLAAVVLIGSSLVAPLTGSAVRGAATLGALRAALDLERRIMRTAPFAALLLLASGLYLGWGMLRFAGWMQVALVLFLVNGFWAARTLKKIAAALGPAAARAGEGPVPPAVDALRRAPIAHVAASVMLANNLATLYLMVMRTDLLPSLVVLALSQAVVGGLWWLRLRAGADATTGRPAGLSAVDA